jgi:hypothetical protein
MIRPSFHTVTCGLQGGHATITLFIFEEPVHHACKTRRPFMVDSCSRSHFVLLSRNRRCQKCTSPSEVLFDPATRSGPEAPNTLRYCNRIDSGQAATRIWTVRSHRCSCLSVKWRGRHPWMSRWRIEAVVQIDDQPDREIGRTISHTGQRQPSRNRWSSRRSLSEHLRPRVCAKPLSTASRQTRPRDQAS